MTRALTIQSGVALCALLAGGTLLARPDSVRRAMGATDPERTTYALRIIGMMLTALGLLLGGFALAFRLAGGVA